MKSYCENKDCYRREKNYSSLLLFMNIKRLKDVLAVTFVLRLVTVKMFLIDTTIIHIFYVHIQLITFCMV